MAKGWVYVITNPAMPGLVKIGFSLKDPELRARELGHTGIPHPYRVEYEALVFEPFSIEQRAHTALKAHREGKEWFRCGVDIAVSVVKGNVVGSLLYENGATQRLPHKIIDPDEAWDTYAEFGNEDPSRMPYLHQAVSLGCYAALAEMLYVCGKDPTLDRGDFQDLVEVERKLFDACLMQGEVGDPGGFLKAALLLEEGKHIPKNEAEFLRLIRLAVDKGSVAARGILGIWVLDRATNECCREEAFLLLRSEYEAGGYYGKIHLVRCYEHGVGTEANTSAALNILSKEVQAGASAFAGWEESLRQKLQSERNLPQD